MSLVPVVTIYADFDGTFVAESIDPAICSKGNTASIALLKLSHAMRQAEENDAPPKSNVVQFRRRA